MSERHAGPQRRRFIRLVVGGALAAPMAGLLHPRPASGADKPKLDPASERAQQFSYTHDAASTDNPARNEGARCANCTHFRGEAGTQWASCNIFPEHRVSINGWCTAWFSAG